MMDRNVEVSDLRFQCLLVFLFLIQTYLTMLKLLILIASQDYLATV